MKDSLTKKIIFDYFDGNHTSIQRKMIEEWLESPENESLFYQYLDEWETLHPQYLIDKEKGFEAINKRIEDRAMKQEKSIFQSSEINFSQVFKWLAAASIVMLSAWYGWTSFSKPTLVSYDNLVQHTKNETGEIYEKQNLTTKPLLISLPDNSSVILQPLSKISYSPKDYNKLKREVILSGEAFFEVKKNSEKPFFVFANDLITKVLGTSFTIKANPTALKTEVIVKTGKVAVFMQNDVDKNRKLLDNNLDGLVLNPNERISINRNENKIEKPIIQKQTPLDIPIHQLSFDFEETSAIEVIEVLKKAYNIEIIYDADKLANCKLTAHLSDEPLIEKIKLICLALEANYEETDGKITIKAKGCH